MPPHPPGYFCLFKPILYVSSFLKKYFSLYFLYSSLLYLTCSRIVALILSKLWPGRLKWALAGWLSILFVIQPLWSATRKLNCCPVSPTYLFLQLSLLHSNKLITLKLSQFTFLFMFHSHVVLQFHFFPTLYMRASCALSDTFVHIPFNSLLISSTFRNLGSDKHVSDIFLSLECSNGGLRKYFQILILISH